MSSNTRIIHPYIAFLLEYERTHFKRLCELLKMSAAAKPYFAFVSVMELFARPSNWGVSGKPGVFFSSSSSSWLQSKVARSCVVFG